MHTKASVGPSNGERRYNEGMTKKPDWAAYGRKGGLKGGKARLRTMTKAERQEIARKAIKARYAHTTKAERQEIARRAAKARWAKGKGKASKTRKPRPQPLLPAPRRTHHTAC